MADSIPLPDGVPLDAATWEQTPLAVRPLVVPQEDRSRTLEARMAEREARSPQRSRNSDRPPSSDPPSEKPTARAGAQGQHGATPGPPGPRQASLEPTQVIEVKPLACVCGQTACPGHQSLLYAPGDRAARDPDDRGGHVCLKPTVPSGATSRKPRCPRTGVCRTGAPADGAHRGAVGEPASQS